MGALEFRPLINETPRLLRRVEIDALVALANRVLDDRVALEGKLAGQDDHVKNIAFLMNRKGDWRLSPAFDVAYSYNPSGAWTSQHQMSINGKRDGFDLDDLITFAGVGGIKRTRAKAMLEEISSVVANWRTYADRAGLPEPDTARIERTHRRELFV